MLLINLLFRLCETKKWSITEPLIKLDVKMYEKNLQNHKLVVWNILSLTIKKLQVLDNNLFWIFFANCQNKCVETTDVLKLTSNVLSKLTNVLP